MAPEDVAVSNRLNQEARVLIPEKQYLLLLEIRTQFVQEEQDVVLLHAVAQKVLLVL